MGKVIFKIKILLLKILLKFYSKNEMLILYRYYNGKIPSDIVNIKIKFTSFLMKLLAFFFDFDRIGKKIENHLNGQKKLQSVDDITVKLQSVDDIILNRFIYLSPINVAYSASKANRLNLMVDALIETGVFGGVATSIVFAVFLAHQLKLSLRIITRDENSSLTFFNKLCKLYSLPKLSEVSLVNFNLIHAQNKLDVSKMDLFVATSWWNAVVVKQINMRKKFIYLLQEYESIFYPKGDEVFLAENIFHDENIIHVVNTKVLYDYFLINGYKQIGKTGLYFEPAFPTELYQSHKSAFSTEKKLNLMFYARPQHPRNMFCTGLKLIDLAIEQNIIDTNKVTIFFSGAIDIPNFSFIDSSQPKKMGKMSYEHYISAISNMDIGVALMMAPCPGYVPLDLASAGAVCLTTQFANKINPNYSKNIIYSALNYEALLANLKICMALAENKNLRKENYQQNNISQSWNLSFAQPLNAIEVMFRVGDL